MWRMFCYCTLNACMFGKRECAGVPDAQVSGLRAKAEGQRHRLLFNGSNTGVLQLTDRCSHRTSCCRPNALVSRPSMLLRFKGCLELLSEPLSLAGGDGGDVGVACPEEEGTLSACPRGLSLTDAGICAGALTGRAVAVTGWHGGPRDQADARSLVPMTSVRRQMPKQASARLTALTCDMLRLVN